MPSSAPDGCKGSPLPLAACQPLTCRHRHACRTASFRLGGNAPEAPKLPAPLPLVKLVDCLVKLGGIAEAQLTLRRHMPTQARADAPRPSLLLGYDFPDMQPAGACAVLSR